MRTRPDVPAVLARHGLVPGPAGFALWELAAAAAARGWGWGVEPVADSRPLRRPFRALVFAPAPAGRRPGATSLSARGRGATEEEALAEALARMLARWA